MRSFFVLFLLFLLFQDGLAQPGNPLDSLRSIPVEKRDAETYYRLGIVYDSLSLLDSGLYCTEKALALVDDEQLEARVRYLNGILNFRTGLYSVAHMQTFKALELSLALSDTSNITDCYWLLGVLAFETGLYDKSIEYYDKGLEYEPDGEGFQISKGAVYIRQKEYFKAIGFFQELLKKFTDPISIATVHNNLGEAFLDLRNYDSAYKHISRTIQITTEQKDSASLMYDKYMFGRYYFELKNYSEAGKYFGAALRLSKKFGDAEFTWNANELPVLYDYLVQVYTAQNKLDSVILMKDGLIELERKRLSQQQMNTVELAFDGQEKRFEELLLQQQKSKRAMVEYYGIAIGLIIILILYFLFNGIDDQKKYSPYVSVVLLILAFEFILIVFDPLLGRLTNNEPVFGFMANVLIALALVPVQQYGERIFNKYAVVVRLKKMEEEKP